jgi:L-lactate dehydrogenase complex protein LldF
MPLAPQQLEHLEEVAHEPQSAPHGSGAAHDDASQGSHEPPSAQFHHDADLITADLRHRDLIQSALGKYYVARQGKQAKFQNWQAARQAAAEVKWEAVGHLDSYLREFCDKIEARGTKVFWADNADEGRDYIVEVIKNAGARRIIKSKTMTGEEIHLNAALEKEGFEVAESDLGEYIVQLREEPPYHFVFPAMHLSRGEISELFQEKLGTESTDDPEKLTMIAREVMREKYIAADVGISGGNFAIAETGMISITENEGNARLTTALPKIHIAIMGIEKVLPKMSDLALFLPMLATAGAGQALTGYNTLIGGPRQPGEIDGPEEFHVVLLNNGRTNLLADPEQRDALSCIRCGACLNVCPIFKNIGGHTYGTTYQGPIGSVITPHLRELHAWKHLSSASSLCGACTETCPVKIDLAHHLLQNRRNAAAEKPVWWEKYAMKGFAWFMNQPKLYRLALKLAPYAQFFHPIVKGSKIDPMYVWTAGREFPNVQRETFKDFWAKRK